MWETLLYFVVVGLIFWAVVAILPAAYQGFRAFRQGRTLKGVLGMGYAILVAGGLTAQGLFVLNLDLLGVYSAVLLLMSGGIAGLFVAGLACSGVAVWCFRKGQKLAALAALAIFLVTVLGGCWVAWQTEQEYVVPSHAEDFASDSADRELLALMETEHTAVYVYRRENGKVLVRPYTAVLGGWSAWETEHLPSVPLGERLMQVMRMDGTEDFLLRLVHIKSPMPNDVTLPTTEEPWTITDSLGNTAVAAANPNGAWEYNMLLTAPDETYTLDIDGVTVPLGRMVAW